MAINFDELQQLRNERDLLKHELSIFEIKKEIKELRRKIVDAQQAEKNEEQMWSAT